MTSHFSLNIKTLSAATNAMVLSLAICRFDEQNIHEKAYWLADLNSQKGREVDSDRFHWWMHEAHGGPSFKPFSSMPQLSNAESGPETGYHPP